METIKRDLKIDTRTTYALTVSLLKNDETPMDLTGYEIKSEIKDSPLSQTVIATFQPTIDLVEAKIRLELSPAESAKLHTVKDTLKPYYDVLLKSPSGIVKKLMKGSITVVKTITTSF